MTANLPPERDIDSLMRRLREELPAVGRRYGVASLGIFGSYVRHEERPDSDLDVLVTFTRTPTLLEFLDLENHLSDVLGVRVDLVMENALRPRIGDRIRQELVLL